MVGPAVVNQGVVGLGMGCGPKMRCVPREGEGEAWSAKGGRREEKGDGDQYWGCMRVVV